MSPSAITSALSMRGHLRIARRSAIMVTELICALTSSAIVGVMSMMDVLPAPIRQ